MRNALIYLRTLRLQHMRKAVAAGVAATGLVVGKALLSGDHVPDVRALAALAAGTALVTFFTKANASTELAAVDPEPVEE